MIHWCSLRFLSFISVQESTLVQDFASFVSEVPNLICIPGKPLSRSNGIGLGWNMAENLNIPAEITNNKDFFEIYSLIYPSFFSSKMMHYYLLIAVYFSLVVRLLIFHILILFKMKNIEIIHRPVWAIIIVIFLFLGFA